jgi:hypothetical protein
MRGRDFILATLWILAPFGATAADLLLQFRSVRHRHGAVRELLRRYTCLPRRSLPSNGARCASHPEGGLPDAPALTR